jgi:hypothetical protein
MDLDITKIKLFDISLLYVIISKGYYENYDIMKNRMAFPEVYPPKRHPLEPLLHTLKAYEFNPDFKAAPTGGWPQWAETWK